jgi:hypothetical protein
LREDTGWVHVGEVPYSQSGDTVGDMQASKHGLDYSFSTRHTKRSRSPVATQEAKKARVLRGGLALDALHLLARDVDRAGELVGL